MVRLHVLRRAAVKTMSVLHGHRCERLAGEPHCWCADRAEWADGVGGVQCSECERTTICKEFGVGQEDDGDSEWLCRPCYLGGSS